MRITPKDHRRLPIKSKDDFTLVVGVDRKHLEQLRIVWPTWRKHKPSLLNRPMVIFADWDEVPRSMACAAIDHPRLRVCSWPQESGLEFRRFAKDDENLKWTHPQRYKMLAGFVHIAAKFVNTKYWMKLDTDVVATGRDDWIDKDWFVESPAIVSHPWGYTKPANQMLELDEWVKANKKQMGFLASKSPLNITPDEDGQRASHKRIISWCSFYSTEFTRWASQLCEGTCGKGQLPVPSQDGVLFYLAKRAEMGIVTPNMKKLGWQHWSTMTNVRKHAQEAMA